jgi:hypothetical protein
LKWFLLSLLLLIAVLYLFILTPFGQNWITSQVTKRFSKELKTKITIKHVDFSLFNKMHLEGVMIEDQKGDTLLYAGDMKVRITDWFFFKKHAELKYIGLSDAIIKFQRTDSVWSQQFLFDYFAGGPKDSTKKQKAGIQFDLRTAVFNNVTFIKKDKWLGNEMNIRVGLLKLDADKMALSGKEFLVHAVLIKDPEVALSNYSGLKIKDNLSLTTITEEIKQAVSWNKNNMTIKVADLKIINGTFKTDKQTERKAFDYFDGKHILFSDINAEFKNAYFNADTITALMNLTARERSGLEVKKFVADVEITPQTMTFSNLNLQTNRSTLRNFYSMTYNHMDDLGDYIHKVKMAAVFTDSYIDSDDIAFFAPSLKPWKKTITLKGKVRGTVDELVGRDMLVQAGNNTVLSGDITLNGLPNVNETFIDFKANDFRTTYDDAVTFLPSMRKVTNPDLRKVRFLNFNGSFTGFIRDFVTYGTIQTNLGTITSDLNMKLPQGKDPLYSGSVVTKNFRLGELLEDAKLGAISMTGTIKGKGFTEKTRNTLIDGKVQFIEYNGYQYENIELNGKLEKRMFTGVASLKDKNANFLMNGTVDYNNKTPRFNLIADVNKANLKNLGITRDSITVKGHLALDFTSNNIDNFLGDARINEAEITKDGIRLPFDSLIISSRYVDNEKKLSLVSNEFKANVSGDFTLMDLPASFSYLLNKYYPAYINPPKKLPLKQDIRFDITTYYVDEYLQLFASGISGFSNSTLVGNLNLEKQQLNLNATIPQLKYKQYNFDYVNLVAQGAGNNLLLSGGANNIRINDSLNIPTASFSIDSRNDSSKVSIVSGVNRTVDTANLNALVLTYSDGVKIKFNPSTFTINSKTWSIDKSGELILRKNTAASGQLVLSEGEQKIVLKTQQSPLGDWNDVNILLTKINLGDFAPYFLPRNRLEGLLSGNVLVENPVNNLSVKTDDLGTQFLRLDNDSLGEVKASVNYNNSLKLLNINGSTANQDNYLGFDGTIYVGDREKAKNNLIVLKAKEFQLSVLERFLGTLFTDIQGYLTGDISLAGEFQNLAVTGKGKLRNAGLKVIFTQCFYKIQDTDIALTPEEINLDGLVLIDTATKNPIYITGGIEHESFKKMFYNLDISTRKPNTRGEENNRPVLLLNTTAKNNQQFYGNVKGTGSLSLLGPQSNMYMKIDAIASQKDSSSITLPNNSSRESGIADFLVERKYGREMTDSDLVRNETSIIYDVDVTANPMVTVKVILDELTGDEIKGKGTGTLNIISGTTEPLSLRGRFDIQEGNYLFTFQSFFKKPFELQKGADNYIEWNGDPYNANINFKARYKAERVSYAPLAKLKQFSSGASSAREDVYVVATLTDKLFKPSIQFALDFPANSVAITDPELALIIQQIQKNINEINRQVTYLIVFNSFAPSELSADPQGGGFNLNTISGIFLGVISDQLNKILGNLLKNEKYNISLNTSIYNRNIFDENNNTALNLGSNVNFSIGRSFFNNRFVISTGIGFDAPLQQSNLQQSIQLLPDVTMEWLINPSGSIRASFFYRENADFLNATSSGPGRARRYGASLNYRKDFDNLGDIFRSRKKKQEAAGIKPDESGELKNEEAPKEN